METSKNKLVIGSRGSALALWQAAHVKSLLEAAHAEIEISIEVISTRGDRILDSPLSKIGGKGLFTKEIEEALLANQIDLAVHSLKDLPTELDPRLRIGAIPERANSHDAFLTAGSIKHALDLPQGATIATGSLRRRAQLLNRRPDLNIVDVRGNVPTRIQKLVDSEWDGMILAAAGLDRLGLTEFLRQRISMEWMLPATGQGALAVEIRAEDERTAALLGPLNDTETVTTIAAERAFLNALGGGCQVPIASHAVLNMGRVSLTGRIIHPTGQPMIHGVHEGPAERASEIGAELAVTLLAQGGREILEHVYSPSGETPKGLSRGSWLNSSQAAVDNAPEP